MAYTSKDIQLRSPSGEMQRIASLISEKEARREEILGIIQEKRAALSESRAEVLLENSRGAKIKVGLAGNALNDFSVELAEVEQTISGLRAKLVEAEAAEKERLYGELSDTVRREGGTLLDLINQLNDIISKHNGIVEEIEVLMRKSFWLEGHQQIVGVSLARLPVAVKKTDKIGPSHFLDRLRIFCDESESIKLPQLASPAQAV